MLKIDHVALCSTNLYETAYQLRDESGLESYEGGYFRGGGVAQRVVPLGNDQYIEIESVIDPEEARGSSQTTSKQKQRASGLRSGTCSAPSRMGRYARAEPPLRPSKP